jgi:hypothetical protein
LQAVTIPWSKKRNRLDPDNVTLGILEIDGDRLQQQPEVQVFLREQGEHHWEHWLDDRLPALGNRTPWEAARTTEGRERLEALFAEFVWSCERTPNAMSPDLTSLRAKLGLR